MTLAFWMYLLRKGDYRDISHIILNHTISNKLVSKVSAQKRGGKRYDSYKSVQISVVNGEVLPKPRNGRLGKLAMVVTKIVNEEKHFRFEVQWAEHQMHPQPTWPIAVRERWSYFVTKLA